MSNGFLSQEEIDSLLNGGGLSPEPPQEEILSDIEKDLLGEIGNISMGSASTALSQIINQQVNITTPVVSVTTLKTLKDSFQVPNIALEVKYISGISGENLLVMKIADAAIIANLMMGGDGKVDSHELSEIEESAVSEAMNQMIGSAATSMATMFAREVNISPPNSKIWNDSTTQLTDKIDENEDIIQVSFRLNIGDLVDSTIMQILPVITAKKIVSIMMGTETQQVEQPKPIEQKIEPQVRQSYEISEPVQAQNYSEPAQARYTEQPQQPPVEVNKASFQPLRESGSASMPRNIDLILDVPLEVSVVLGRTKKSIKDILNLGTGSLIELDKLAEEPVEILVNGKIVAYGEVIVVDENFGVRLTSIVSNAERVKSLSQ
ncbi:flagellar motor switch phosphatase FliY [Clostridium sp. YIM B02515]|uniref:Flagellar motor switch phosphatase FliY n=1 Tax=Clostridium rhizosphaerae TaxID=2803861 RepID=A0ABS1TFA0_9CLOT|nr:flagellar motor switch phosphatase FliY [Clostridium rhizosphaerae]MBL4938015.1 flagellar motor switch phosphatase FliY [Clostridium rhizosphaerae]